MLVLLALNNIHIVYAQEDLINLFLGVGSSTKGYSEVLNWIVSHLC